MFPYHKLDAAVDSVPTAAADHVRSALLTLNWWLLSQDELNRRALTLAHNYLKGN